MTNEITTALIAAGVSIVVAAAAGTATFVTTRASLHRDHERQEADFRRAMTTRLYDRRVSVYPGLFQATAAFRRSNMHEASNIESHLRDAIDRVNSWHEKEGGLLLSSNAHQELLDLRQSVKDYLRQREDDSSTPLDEATRLLHEERLNSIWRHKNDLRAAMRKDLGLLFDEDRDRSDREGIPEHK